MNVPHLPLNRPGAATVSARHCPAPVSPTTGAGRAMWSLAHRHPQFGLGSLWCGVCDHSSVCLMHLPSLQTIETKSQSFCHAQSAACLLSVLKFLIVEPSDFLQCSKFKWGQSQPKNHSSKLSPVGLATNSAGHRGNLTACCKPLQCLLSNTSSHQLL
jgi:hypothetical protein